MATKVKIKITDNRGIRTEIDQLAELLNPKEIVAWALLCASHVLPHSEIEPDIDKALLNAFGTVELWLKGNTTIEQVRLESLKIHALARQGKTAISKAALRAAGQAISVVHMHSHAMLCADYAVKAIQIVYPNRLDKITAERQWQLNELKRLLNSET